MDFKLYRKTSIYLPTWRGVLLILAIVAAFMVTGFFMIHDYLSVDCPVNGELLVLDGTIPDYAVAEAIAVFQKGNYEMVVTTGGKIEMANSLLDYSTRAELTRAVFISMGLDSGSVIAIPGGHVISDRTYSSSLNLKEWLESERPNVLKIDLLTVGCHARRSRYLFRRGLGDRVEVGIISVTNPAYDPKRWWQSSIGARAVISESVGYLYALIK